MSLQVTTQPTDPPGGRVSVSYDFTVAISGATGTPTFSDTVNAPVVLTLGPLAGVPNTGGAITLAATATGASSYVFAYVGGSPAVTVSSTPVLSTLGSAQSESIVLPTNSANAGNVYTFSCIATGPGGTSSALDCTVTVPATPTLIGAVTGDGSDETASGEWWDRDAAMSTPDNVYWIYGDSNLFNKVSGAKGPTNIRNLLGSTYAISGVEQIGLTTGTVSSVVPGTVGFIIETAPHHLVFNDQVSFTGGTMPSGLTAGQIYYIGDVISSTEYALSSTPSGSLIPLGSAGSGSRLRTLHKKPGPLVSPFPASTGSLRRWPTGVCYYGGLPFITFAIVNVSGGSFTPVGTGIYYNGTVINEQNGTNYVYLNPRVVNVSGTNYVFGYRFGGVTTGGADWHVYSRLLYGVGFTGLGGFGDTQLPNSGEVAGGFPAQWENNGTFDSVNGIYYVVGPGNTLPDLGGAGIWTCFQSTDFVTWSYRASGAFPNASRTFFPHITPSGLLITWHDTVRGHTVGVLA